MDISAREAIERVRRNTEVIPKNERWNETRALNSKIIEALELLEKKEQGLAIELPCPIPKVDDDTTIYLIEPPYSNIWEYNNNNIQISVSGNNAIKPNTIVYNIGGYDFYKEDIGKTVFFSYEEAENAVALEQKKVIERILDVACVENIKNIPISEEDAETIFTEHLCKSDISDLDIKLAIESFLAYEADRSDVELD